MADQESGRKLDHMLGQRLTTRQIEILRGIADGKTYAEIGRELFVTEDTVRTHVRRILARLGARCAAHAVHLGHQRGLLHDRGTEDHQPPAV